MRTIILSILIFTISYSKHFLKVDNILKYELLYIKKKPSTTAGTIETIAYNTRCIELIKCKLGVELNTLKELAR